jgi:hypothetical protein
VNDPRVLIYVTAEAPRVAVQFGNTVASPVAKRILEQVLPYLGVTPDPSDQPANTSNKNQQGAGTNPAGKSNFVTVPGVEGKDSQTAVESLKAAGLKGQLTGKPGPVKHQWPAAGVEIPKGGGVVLQTPPREDGKVVVPDVRGLNMRDVADLCAVLGLKLTASGDGWAVSQDLRPGQVVAPGTAIRVEFDSHPPGT